MGIFAGELRFTVYQGTNPVRLEAIATSDEPSVAYKWVRLAAWDSAGNAAFAQPV